MVLAGWARGEDDPFALPGKGRPRIRSYDQRPRPVRAGGPSWRDSSDSESAEPDLLPEARRNLGLSREAQFGFSRVTEIPVMGPVRETEDDDDSERTPLVNPMDFLDESDLFADGELESEDEPEEEQEVLVDWDTLQEALIQDELDAVEPPDSREEEEEEAEAFAADWEENPGPAESGLGLSNVLPDPSAPEARGRDRVGNVNAPSERSAPDRNMESVLRMGAFESRPPPSRDFEGPESLDAEDRQLSGSRRLFDEVRDRWRPAADESPGRSAPSSPPANARESSPAALNRFEPTVTTLPASRPGVSSETRSPSLSPSPTEGREGGSESNVRRRFQRDDGRVRSLIGR